MQIDPVLVVGGAAVLGGLAVVSPLPVAVAAAGMVWLLARGGLRWTLAVAALALGLTAVRAAQQVAGFEMALGRTRTVLGGPRRCAGIATVETSPVRRTDSLAYLARFDSLDCEGTTTLRDVRARLHGGQEALARGDRVEIVAQIAVVELFRNAELSDPAPSAARAGAVVSGGVLSSRVVRTGRTLLSLLDRARGATRERIDRTFAPDAAPLARALVLGENDLPDEEAAAFRASGLSHLLAVSGTHLVFAVLGIVRGLSYVLVRVERLSARWDVGRLSAVVGVVLAPAYADFAGGSGSAWRAALMLAIGLFARALGRAPDATRSFAWSLAASAMWEPLFGFDVSFLLSVAATAGLLLWGKTLSARLAPRHASLLRRAAGASAAATLSATIPCAPLLSVLGPRLTIAGALANVVAAPFGEVVSLPLCLLHAIVPLEACARGIGLVAGGALLVVAKVARVSASASWLMVPVPPPGAWHFVVLGIGATGALLSGQRPGSARGARPPAERLHRALHVVATLVATVVVEAAAVRHGHPTGALRVTVLDVGQGDSTLIDLPDGALLLVDGGGFVGSPVDPGRSVILPLLRERRRTRVDIVVLSHPHPDHFLGLVSALPEIEVGEFWDTGEGREHGAGPRYAALIAGLAARHIPIRGPASLCGPPRALGGAEVEILSPCPAWDPALGSNDNSFVMRLGHRGRAVLLMGDAEREEESRLLSRRLDLRANLLKVGHHGSRTSTSAALLDRVHPQVATVSSGVRNRFGHPHGTTLTGLRSHGVTLLRTDLSGSVEWTDAREAFLLVAGASALDRALVLRFPGS